MRALGMRRGDERDVLHARQRDVGDVAAAAGDEARIFLGAALLADVAEVVRVGDVAHAHFARFAEPRGRELDRVDDLLIAGAAAEVAADRFADLRRRSAADSRSSSACAAISMPGVQ